MTIAEIEDHKALAQMQIQEAERADDPAIAVRHVRRACHHLLQVVSEVGALQIPPAVEPALIFRREEDGDMGGDIIEVFCAPTVTGRLDLRFELKGSVFLDGGGEHRMRGHIRGDSVIQFWNWLDGLIERYGAKIK